MRITNLFTSVSDPESLGSVDIDPDSESGFGILKKLFTRKDYILSRRAGAWKSFMNTEREKYIGIFILCPVTF
jgi:hypothetical protein